MLLCCAIKLITEHEASVTRAAGTVWAFICSHEAFQALRSSVLVLCCLFKLSQGARWFFVRATATSSSTTRQRPWTSARKGMAQPSDEMENGRLALPRQYSTALEAAVEGRATGSSGACPGLEEQTSHRPAGAFLSPRTRDYLRSQLLSPTQQSPSNPSTNAEPHHIFFFIFPPASLDSIDSFDVSSFVLEPRWLER